MPQGVTPWKAVAQLTSPGFVIMDCNNKQVVLVTEKGDIQHTYRGQEGFMPSDIVYRVMGNNINTLVSTLILRWCGAVVDRGRKTQLRVT